MSYFENAVEYIVNQHFKDVYVVSKDEEGVEYSDYPELTFDSIDDFDKNDLIYAMIKDNKIDLHTKFYDLFHADNVSDQEKVVDILRCVYLGPNDEERFDNKIILRTLVRNMIKSDYNYVSEINTALSSASEDMLEEIRDGE